MAEVSNRDELLSCAETAKNGGVNVKCKYGTYKIANIHNRTNGSKKPHHIAELHDLKAQSVLFIPLNWLDIPRKTETEGLQCT